MNSSQKLSVCLYSDANFLAVGLLENLLSRNCTVNILTNDVKSWKKRTSQISLTNKFSILDIRNASKTNRFDYTIFCGGYIDKYRAYVDYQAFTKLIGYSSSKILIIFPFEIYDKNTVDGFEFSDNTAVLFTGDLIGPRIDFESNLLMPSLLYNAIWKRKINLPVGEVFYPMFIADAVRVIVKWLFSFGPYGKHILFLGNQISGDIFWGYLRKQFGNVEINYSSNSITRKLPRDVEIETINNNLQLSLNQTHFWIASNATKPSVSKVKPVIKKARIPFKVPATVIKITNVILVVFLLPLITLLVSFATTFVGYRSLLGGNPKMAQNSILFSETVAVIAEKESYVLSKIPILSYIYRELEFTASLTANLDRMISHAIPISVDTAVIFGKILGKEVYNPSELSGKIESQINLLFEDASNADVVVERSAKSGVFLAKYVLSKYDLKQAVKLFSETRILVKNLPNLLGYDQNKTYLILFQNNMELRPTGGFIGSFGLVTFDGGRLSDLTVSDVYSADGQLNGHVEPPEPIKKYLGEANWWLRDSNWDPDFPTSAKRAEWFLEKELGKKVDGVVGIDLYPIKEILKITGDTFLPDFNVSINSDNLYEKTQGEVEENFFPGTYKKASFLTALSRSLLGGLGGLTSNQKMGVLKVFYESLSSRHLQIYFHDVESQNSIARLQWDGAVISPTCGSDCYADFIGLVESNVGVNKANYFIKRDIKVDVIAGPRTINRKVTINLNNSANSALGPSGRYFPYVRLLIPSDSNQVSVVSLNGNTREILVPDIVEVRGHKEVGVPIEILGGGTKSLEFSWNTYSEKISYKSYGLYIRKQAGTESDQIKVNVGGNQMQIVPDPRFSLTRGGIYTYNTTLVRDLFALFSW